MEPKTETDYEAMSAKDGTGESFIATASAVGVPTPEATPYLEVVAPATLSEGYTFEAEADGTAFTVTVPRGGVEKGQKFSVPVTAGSDEYSGAAVPRTSVPVGHWKDDTFACCALGFFHPTFWSAWCCPLILLGQVMHRLKLTWMADVGGTPSQTASTFRIMFWIGIVTWFVLQFLPLLPRAFVDENGLPTTMYYRIDMICQVVTYCYLIFRTVLITKTRQHIRSKYHIPEQQCHNCEDCCCAWWCGCCTVSQMARHTGDYEAYQAMCCSETGMPPHAPSIV